MITTFIKFFFIYKTSLLITKKILRINKFSFLNEIILSIMLSLSTYILHSASIGLGYIIPLLFLWLLIGIIDSRPQLSFVSIILSYTISFCSHAVISFMITALLMIRFEINSILALLALATGLIQIYLTHKFFCIKRYKNGISFLSTSISLNIATILCLSFICLTIYMSSNISSIHHSTIGNLFIIASTLSLAFLIYWWQAQIRKSYRRSLELRELESLRTEVAELNLLIQKLSEDNERLARITHRDNTLITTLKNATIRYLYTDFSNPSDAIAERDKLVQNINLLNEGRISLDTNLVTKTEQNFHPEFTLLNELLNQISEYTLEQNINFSVHFGTDLSDFIPKDISEIDLVHTIDDLLKNAFKSTRNNEKRMVQLQFYKLGKHFVVEVSDNGIPFEVESLVCLGLEKRTTYEDGSGHGLVDIWTTKSNYLATYHLDEYEIPSPFSKKISLTFDKKNRYSIRTWRKTTILQHSKRIDLQVYDYIE